MVERQAVNLRDWVLNPLASMSKLRWWRSLHNVWSSCSTFGVAE